MHKVFLAILFMLISATLLAVDEVVWIKARPVKNVIGAYTPVVLTSATTIRVYSNSDGQTFGDLWMRTGTWSSVGPAVRVFPANQITDQVGTPFIRTTGIVRGASGQYYGLWHVGAGYPSSTGFRPACAGMLILRTAVARPTSAHALVIVRSAPMNIVCHIRSSFCGARSANSCGAWNDDSKPGGRP